MLQSSCYQRCRLHFPRNLLRRVPKVHQGMVNAARPGVSLEEGRRDVALLDDLSSSLGEHPRRQT